MMKWTERKLYGTTDKRMTAALPDNYAIDLVFRKDAQSTAKFINGCTLTEVSFPATSLESAQAIAEEKIGDWIAENAARWDRINEMFETARRTES